ncbi:unnamed protein product [Candidula unifasciata]|uniref:Domain of unknown function with conserved HDNR motif domain-containing protein n=1 Tax=Candidula unifasciata TaxID=100452 RepID=A0A8S3YJ21_9EUPU|nr:unnamed protein product [Candidula unifasciata]
MSVKVNKGPSSHCHYYTVGSWFPTGYYGHYRSRARVDFVNEYRQLAKPQPPQRFIQRSLQPADYHLFSIHDNRNSFQCDASYFSQGLGRKRHPDRSGIFDPNILSWPPYRENPKLDRPLTSTYRKDFKKDEPNVQLLVKRPLTSFDTVTTTYRSVHGKDSPNHNLINALNNEALLITTRSRLYQARKKKSGERETVASCLTWFRAPVPPATSQAKPPPPLPTCQANHPATCLTDCSGETQSTQEGSVTIDNICMSQEMLPTQMSMTLDLPRQESQTLTPLAE